MMKLVYKQEQYEYENVGAQSFDIKVEMEIKEHANVEEAVAAFMRYLQIAGYSCLNKENVMKAVEEYFDGDYYI